ncbi:MAG: SOS response-associated peptidase [Propionibacteriaceae bacterium]|nr:SOS response-associated peptidase [Micropruina sp.]HBX80437.1 DUF159 family protein [Propionibacteriaceae bacterium]HBY23603.1 DUF159 family protein [Propionibacteriaceae bacterium]
MCGRYAASASQGDLVEVFEIAVVDESLPAPKFNIAPTDPVPAVVERADKVSGEIVRSLVGLRWGLVPSWSKSLDGGARMINARVETVAEKPAFRTALAKRRCLLPADGYYEWYTHTGSNGKPAKQPFFIHPSNGGPLVMAGLYEFWRGPDGVWVPSCTIITTEATDALGVIHDRMPMIVHPDAWDAWLDPRLDAGALELLTVAGPELTAYAVGTAVGNVRNQGPELLDPLPVS